MVCTKWSCLLMFDLLYCLILKYRRWPENFPPWHLNSLRVWWCQTMLIVMLKVTGATGRNLFFFWIRCLLFSSLLLQSNTPKSLLPCILLPQHILHEIFLFFHVKNLRKMGKHLIAMKTWLSKYSLLKKVKNFFFYFCEDLLVVVPVPDLRVERLCFIAQISF